MASWYRGVLPQGDDGVAHQLVRSLLCLGEQVVGEIAPINFFHDVLSVLHFNVDLADCTYITMKAIQANIF